jgi:hypothetical protein
LWAKGRKGVLPDCRLAEEPVHCDHGQTLIEPRGKPEMRNEHVHQFVACYIPGLLYDVCLAEEDALAGTV